MKKIVQLSLLGMFVLSFFMFAKTFAQDVVSEVASGATDTVVEAVAVDVDATDVVSDVANELDPVEIQATVVMDVPSSFGMFWKSFKEAVSLTFTFDPIKKAEKRIEYAQENIVTANYILENSVDEKEQEKAQKMLERANNFITKAQEKKEFFEENPDEVKTRILENITTLEVNAQKLLSKMEGKFAVEKLEKLAELETKINERQERFLSGFLSNPNVPEEVKQHMTELKAEIAAKQIERIQERAEHKDLIEKALSGDVQAQEELQTLRETKMEEKKDEMEQFKEAQEELREQMKETVEQRDQMLEQNKERLEKAVESGDENAAARLERLDEIQERRAEMEAKIEERRNEIEEKRLEIQNERE